MVFLVSFIKPSSAGKGTLWVCLLKANNNCIGCCLNKQRTMPVLTTCWTISICLKPGLNKTELWSAGYSDEMFYTFERSQHNKTHFGSGGHTKDGKYMHANISVLLAKLAIWKDLSDVVSYFLLSGKTHLMNQFMIKW